MFNPDKTDYPTNAAGSPEFATIIATLDSVSQNPALGDDVVQKFVLSTQDLIAALTANAVYFNQPDLLANPANARLLVEAGRASNPVFVYLTPRQDTVQIITTTPTWEMLVQHPDFGNGSMLVALHKSSELIGQALENIEKFAGALPALNLLDLSPENISAPAAGDPAPESSNEHETAATGGNAAESLVETADIEEA